MQRHCNSLLRAMLEIVAPQNQESPSDKEKIDMTPRDYEGKLDSPSSSQFIDTDDPFPESPDDHVEDQQLTIRAVLVGCILGGVISASNIYIGLKTGLAFSSSLFGAILGFAILKPLSRTAPTFLGGGYFGPKENNICQSAATSAGSMGLIFTTGLPAAYQLGLLSAQPKDDIGRLFTFAFCCAFFGLSFTQPLRKFYILKLKLVFPLGVAAAQTIQSLHVGKGAEAIAGKKTRALIYAFIGATLWRIVSEYAPGLLWDWHIFYVMNKFGLTLAIAAESWGWIWEWTPAFVGVGMITGANASYSLLGGSFLAWAIIGPVIVAQGLAVGVVADPAIPGYMSYMSMNLADPIHQPSPRYWMLWPGTVILVCASFAEVGCNSKSLYLGMRSAFGPLLQWFSGTTIEDDNVVDPVPEHERVPLWAWSSLLVISIIVTCIVMNVQFGQNVGVTLLAIIFAFLFSLMGCESEGRTSMNLVTSAGNASQVIFGSLASGQNYPIKRGQLLNLLTGMLTIGASEQAGHMVQDLKTTHLLRSSPRAVFVAQLLGSVVSIVISASLYVVFSTAYPCINDLTHTTCAFSMPEVQSWRAVAVAVSSTTLPIPPSSGYTAIALGLTAIMSVVAKYTVVPPRYHDFIPNFNALAIGMMLNVASYPLAMVFGSTLAIFWRRKYFNNYQIYCYPIAAGFIAGEGVGGIINAVFTIVGVSGATYGTSAGCPGGIYCG